MDSPIEIPQDFPCEKCGKPRERSREHYAYCQNCQDDISWECAKDSLDRYLGSASERITQIVSDIGMLFDDEKHDRPPAKWVVKRLLAALTEMLKEAK